LEGDALRSVIGFHPSVYQAVVRAWDELGLRRGAIEMRERSVDLVPVMRRVAVIGGLGMHPIERLSIPARRLLACMALRPVADLR